MEVVGPPPCRRVAQHNAALASSALGASPCPTEEAEAGVSGGGSGKDEQSAGVDSGTDESADEQAQADSPSPSCLVVFVAQAGKEARPVPGLSHPSCVFLRPDESPSAASVSSLLARVLAFVTPSADLGRRRIQFEFLSAAKERWRGAAAGALVINPASFNRPGRCWFDSLEEAAVRCAALPARTRLCDLLARTCLARSEASAACRRPV